MLDKFVCVRVIHMWGVDLSLFRFDGNLTWAVFFMNADRVTYGRYGTRSHGDPDDDISLAGFKKALQAALRLHAEYPENKQSLAAKTAAKSQWPTAERYPALKGKFRREEVRTGGCIHCHHVPEGRLKSAWMQRKPVPDRLLWTFPMPDLLGMIMDPKERATVKTILPGSESAAKRVQVGDRILRIDGQPITSIADVQWVLHNAEEPSVIRMELDRGGESVQAALRINKGWRRKANFTDRWENAYDYPMAPGFRSRECRPERRKALGLNDDDLALEVWRVFPGDNGWGSVVGKGFQFVQGDLRKGDVIVALDGRSGAMRESDLVAYVWQQKRPAELLQLTVLRDDRRERVTIRTPSP